MVLPGVFRLIIFGFCLVNIWIDWRTDDDLVAIGTESPAIYDHRKGGIIKNLKSTGKG